MDKPSQIIAKIQQSFSKKERIQKAKSITISKRHKVIRKYSQE